MNTNTEPLVSLCSSPAVQAQLVQAWGIRSTRARQVLLCTGSLLHPTTAPLPSALHSQRYPTACSLKTQLKGSRADPTAWQAAAKNKGQGNY